MPSSSKELQDKFVTYGEKGEWLDDGITKAENMIKNCGGTIVGNGLINLDHVTDVDSNLPAILDMWDAVDYLVNEWDYGIK